MNEESEFARALVSPGPTQRYAERMRRFGRLVGSWSVTSRLLDEHSGEWGESARIWTFGYILDGRGVQDVLSAQVAGDPASLETQGTTVRIYDPTLGVWRVSWFGVTDGEYCSLMATGHGGGIRQDGTQTDGRPIRWNFSDITDDSFSWDGWVSNDDGATWWLQQHMDAVRLNQSA
ncbi:hypothetical protein [Leifsonia sp. Root112D2]|jgi:hypothetical protein|uniref:hypothetical protein n=1 Tax=Leifsonia sp. Root112D2 TaxID=1736426 RepID=UPI00070008B5|nr:hypothetical protein [Leifsonia sp. Root112D2]KQV06823.1 hypothetical protein ASC63_05435 [Leifsonia sp. Root112D2]